MYIRKSKSEREEKKKTLDVIVRSLKLACDSGYLRAGELCLIWIGVECVSSSFRVQALPRREVRGLFGDLTLQ